MVKGKAMPRIPGRCFPRLVTLSATAKRTLTDLRLMKVKGFRTETGKEKGTSPCHSCRRSFRRCLGWSCPSDQSFPTVVVAAAVGLVPKNPSSAVVATGFADPVFLICPGLCFCLCFVDSIAEKVTALDWASCSSARRSSSERTRGFVGPACLVDRS